MYHQKDRFGVIKLPSVAYANFRQLRSCGFLHPGYTWQQANEAYRTKLQKKKIARLSRRANRGR